MLIIQKKKYKQSVSPYDVTFGKDESSILWWETIDDASGDFLQKLALRLLKLAQQVLKGYLVH